MLRHLGYTYALLGGLLYIPSMAFSEVHGPALLAWLLIVFGLGYLVRRDHARFCCLDSLGGGSHALLSRQHLYIPRQDLYMFCVIAFLLLNLIYFVKVIQGGGHQALYTDGSDLGPASVPLKILAVPGLYLILLRLATASRVLDEKLALIALLSLTLSGSRGLFVFSVLSIYVLRQGAYLLTLKRSVLLVMGSLACFVAVGYFREDVGMSPGDYLLLVAASFNEFAFSNLSVSSCDLPAGLWWKEFSSIFLSRIDDSRFTWWLTQCFNPSAHDGGYGIAASALGEFIQIAGNAGFLLYLLYGMGLLGALVWLNRWPNPLLASVSIVALPFSLYTIRAEISYPLVFFVKAIVSLSLLYFVERVMLRSPKLAQQRLIFWRVATTRHPRPVRLASTDTP